MSFDHLSLPSHHRKPPDIDAMNTINTNTTNSLKHRTSPQYDYKYSKNKHLSQQIHKKKKNRNKQTYHKKKKLIKLSKNIHKKKHKKPKLKKSLSANHADNVDTYDLYGFPYINKHNEMNHKHKKIQVINNSDAPYYLHPTTVSSKNLNNYNYNYKKKTNIIWVQSPQIMHCSPSPMLLPTNLSSTTKRSSPFLLPIACGNINKSPYHSPSLHAMHLTQNGANKGEVLMGFEDGNILIHDMCPSRSQMSAALSDYKYEGLQSHRNPERIDDDISYCLNILRCINTNDCYNAEKVCMDKLNEIGRIVQELKHKIGHKCEEDKDNDEQKDNGSVGLSTDERTDSTCMRTHLSDTNTSDEEHQDEDEDDDDSKQSMISGVKFMEQSTPDGSNDIVYYD